jgi:hypothetical protein
MPIPPRMASPPTTSPETWVPAGAEGAGATTAPPKQAQPAQGPARRRPNVTLPPPEGRRQDRRPNRVLRLVKALGWTLLSAATPWAWFLVRDLGQPIQLVALALPAVVVAAILGLVIAAIDERKITTLVVAVSVAAFGWVTIFGPRGPLPSPPPVDPVRIATITLPDLSSGVDASTIAAIARTKADLTIIVEPSKKARSSLLRTDHSRFTLVSGRFVVLSSAPVRELALPDPLPGDLILRLQVDRPGGAFIVYAVRTNDSVLGTTLNDPLLIDRLTKAALAERLPVVLAGDFGISDRSTGYRTLAGAFRDALRSGSGAGSTARTFPWSFLFLRTDFVLTSPSWCAAGSGTFDVQGAEQHGVTTTVGPCKR